MTDHYMPALVRAHIYELERSAVRSRRIRTARQHRKASRART
jgi:hypothetical protein